MKALSVEENGALHIVEIEKQKINDYQVLVRMLAGGICNGTDAKIIHGKFKGFHTYPAILGHEGVGEVVEMGRFVENFKLGDHVLCPFQEGMNGPYHSGWGAFAEYAVCWDWKALVKSGVSQDSPDFPVSAYTQKVIPKSMDPVHGSMMITFREVLSAMKTFALQPNKSIVIYGCGPVGASFTKFAKILGLGPIIVCDLTEERMQKARTLGADETISSTDPEILRKIRAICPQGVDYVVDAVGRSQIINQAMNLVTFNGKICVYGISPNNSMELDWTNSEYNWQLQFVQWPTKWEEAQAHQQVMNWIQTGILHPEEFYSHVVPFEKILDGFAMTANQEAFKVMVTF